MTESVKSRNLAPKSQLIRRNRSETFIKLRSIVVCGKKVNFGERAGKSDKNSRLFGSFKNNDPLTLKVWMESKFKLQLVGKRHGGWELFPQDEQSDNRVRQRGFEDELIRHCTTATAFSVPILLCRHSSRRLAGGEREMRETA